MDIERIAEQIVQDYQMPEKGVDLWAVLKLCRPFMDRLCQKPPKDWVQYSYELLRSRFFPGNFHVECNQEHLQAVEFYLNVLNRLFAREKCETAFDPCRDFQLMTEEEETFCGISDEYRTFLHCFYDQHVYAFMRLSGICSPYNTLGHVAGVHHVAMYMARQLLGSEVAVDPGLMSAAAMTHDMGKFGCRPSEASRVPYLHYYYTYQFCRRFELQTIGSIASNHSVWDLELENLSVESLLLIYADFRVKSVFDEAHKEQIRFWTLDDAYDVILSKLDHVDEKKKNRYAKVYRKLKDFENYMISLGCSTDLKGGRKETGKVILPELMTPDQIIQRFKELAIRFNLTVMHDTWHADRFITLLEKIRSEKDWRHVRAYLTAIEEYSIYFPQEQKKQILTFLYEMMSHRDGDIRRQAAAIAGKMIADYEIVFTKEIPDGYQIPRMGESLESIWKKFLKIFLLPDRSMQEKQVRWSGYAMKSVLHALLMHASEKKKSEILHIYIEQCDETKWDNLVNFILIDCAAELPFSVCETDDARRLSGYAVRLAKEKTGEIRVASMWFILLWLRQGWVPEDNLSGIFRERMEDMNQEPYCIRYLEARIREFYGIASEQGVRVYDLTKLYLENQRAEVPWIYKYLNLEILKKRQAQNEDTNQLYQYASHLLNVLQFGDRIVNRLQAGENLIDIMPNLEHAQRYEIILELIRALEIGEYAVSKYIPQYLGSLLLQLPSDEHSYFMEKLRSLITGINEKAAIVALETVGNLLQELPANYIGNGAEAMDWLLEEAEGLLCMGLAHFDEAISQETFYITGQKIFGSTLLSKEWKGRYFSDLGRKILSLTDWSRQGLYVYFNAAAFNHIYRFISDYEHEFQTTPLVEKKLPAAFFPGTFDPFSLGHREIVKEIRKMGFRVYLSLDEFSWSKKAQPYEIRRKILLMSSADMKDVFLFPREIPVNIANPEDMRTLRGVFYPEKVHVVAGSDVVQNASAYRSEEKEDSVRAFPHIIFARNDDSVDQEEVTGKIFGEVHYIQLPPYFENVSSTRIRENIGSNKDITDLVENMVQNYIYRYGLYAMEPTYKKMASSLPIDTYVEHGNGDLERELRETGMTGRDISGKTQEQVMYLRDQSNQGKICGAVFFHEIDQMGLFEECRDVRKAAFVRSHVSGKIAVITQVAGVVSELDDKRLTALNEALGYFQENSFSYALCFCPGEYEELLSLHGFIPLEDSGEIYILDLRTPLVVFYDTPASLKESVAGNVPVRKAIRNCHLRLLKALTALYPGQLILCFESNVMNYRLMKLITEENKVGLKPDPQKRLGPKMCVPFGKILKGVRIPNTVTKGLDTEKIYDEDLQHFSIVQFPGYAPLELQIRTIKSFRRPVILTDDLYHHGYRAEKIDACLQKEHLTDAQLVVGVLSGSGKDLAKQKGKEVKAVYSVPNMKAWLIESDLYPFLGGDGVKTNGKQTAPPLSLASVNTILPYETPSFLEGASLEDIYHLSETCLENTKVIFSVLEREYSRQYGRRLTMERISEVVAEPRHPDSIGFDEETLQETPSFVIEKEIRRLRRLQSPTDQR